MNDHTPEDEAIENADPTLIAASLSLKKTISSYLKTRNVPIPAIDSRTLENNLSDILLGILPIKTAAAKIVEESIEYEIMATLLEGIFKEVFSGVLPQLKKYSVNKDAESMLFIDTLSTETSTRQAALAQSSVKTTAQILAGSSEDAVRDHPYTDRKQTLSEIENPTPTVATPAFALPNTKPNTADILKGIAVGSSSASTVTAQGAQDQALDETASLIIPPGLDLSIDTAGIVDPLKMPAPVPTPTFTPAPTPIAAQMTPQASQQSISSQMNSKLGSVTGSAARESFKIMPLSETMRNLTANQAGATPGTSSTNVASTGMTASGAASVPRGPDPYREPIS